MDLDVLQSNFKSWELDVNTKPFQSHPALVVSGADPLPIPLCLSFSLVAYIAGLCHCADAPLDELTFCFD